MPAHPHPPSVPEFRRIDGSIRAKHESESSPRVVALPRRSVGLQNAVQREQSRSPRAQALDTAHLCHDLPRVQHPSATVTQRA